MRAKLCFTILAVAMLAAFTTVSQAGAETMKFRQVQFITKAEVLQVGDVPDHIIGIYDQTGLASFDTGEVASLTVKWEQVGVGDEEGHVVAVIEDKGIESSLMGRTLSDGILYRGVTLLDANLKTWLGSMVGYGEYTDRDGDKYYDQSKGKLVGRGGWEGEWAFVKGTGKFEGIQGKGTWSGVTLGPIQWYVDWEGEMELPKR